MENLGGRVSIWELYRPLRDSVGPQLSQHLRAGLFMFRRCATGINLRGVAESKSGVTPSA
jgi:hypothetical protein